MKGYRLTIEDIDDDGKENIMRIAQSEIRGLRCICSAMRFLRHLRRMLFIRSRSRARLGIRLTEGKAKETQN